MINDLSLYPGIMASMKDPQNMIMLFYLLKYINDSLSESRFFDSFHKLTLGPSVWIVYQITKYLKNISVKEISVAETECK